MAVTAWVAASPLCLDNSGTLKSHLFGNIQSVKWFGIVTGEEQ